LDIHIQLFENKDKGKIISVLTINGMTVTKMPAFAGIEYGKD